MVSMLMMDRVSVRVVPVVIAVFATLALVFVSLAAAEEAARGARAGGGGGSHGGHGGGHHAGGHHGGHHGGHFHHHGCCWGGFYASPFFYPYAYPYPYYAYPYPYYAYPYPYPDSAYAPAPGYTSPGVAQSISQPAPQASQTLNVQREVVYDQGKYVLYGDGITQPWQWVWVPNAPPAPPR